MKVSWEEGKQLRKFNSLKEFVTEYYRLNPDGHYFDTATMYYYGEKLSEMRVSRDAELLLVDKLEMIGSRICHIPQWYEAFYLLKKIRRPATGLADLNATKFNDKTEIVYFDAATLQPVLLDEISRRYLIEEPDVVFNDRQRAWQTVWVGDRII